MMGTIVCQTCNSIIDHYEGEKVQVLYATCGCEECNKKSEPNK